MSKSITFANPRSPGRPALHNGRASHVRIPHLRVVSFVTAFAVVAAILLGTVLTELSGRDKGNGEMGLIAVPGGAATATGDAPPGEVALASTGSPELAWKQNGRFGTYTPTIVKNRVFAVRERADERSHDLVAFDLLTGNETWSTEIPNIYFGDIVVADGIVVVDQYDDTQQYHTLLAFKQRNGAPVWNYAVGAIVNASPASVGDSLYFSASDGSIRALDAKTGIERWRSALSDATGSVNDDFPVAYTDIPLRVADDVIYGAGSDMVFAISAIDGAPKWSFRMIGWAFGELAFTRDKVFAVTVHSEEAGGGWPGRLYAIDAASGEKAWGPVGLNSMSHVTAGRDAIYVANIAYENAATTAYDAQSGDVLWSVAVGGMLQQPVLANRSLYVASTTDGVIRRFNPETGAVEGGVYLAGWSPAISDGMLIAIGRNALIAVKNGQDDTNAPRASGFVDISGLPSCAPPRQAPTGVIAGKPAATISAETRLEEREGGTGSFADGRTAPYTEWPQILQDNVPGGDVVLQHVADELRQTLNGIVDCGLRPEGPQLIQGFFTDDFFRRGILTAGPSGYSMAWFVQPEESDIETMTAVTLDDGRIGVSIGDNIHSANLFAVFVKVDGQWLIDEFYRVVTEYNFGPLG